MSNSLKLIVWFYRQGSCRREVGSPDGFARMRVVVTIILAVIGKPGSRKTGMGSQTYSARMLTQPVPSKTEHIYLGVLSCPNASYFHSSPNSSVFPCLCVYSRSRTWSFGYRENMYSCLVWICISMVDHFVKEYFMVNLTWTVTLIWLEMRLWFISAITEPPVLLERCCWP